ncbi:MAG: ABC transporter permease [Vicinamibacteria bacterium]|nr:ABC transporter permease [Vicinamibacteria bacterium]
MIANDLRLAWRSLRRRPGSTALAVAALALGIGANAAIFSFVDAIVLRPLPYPEADRLVDLTQSEGPHSTGLGAVSPRDLDDFKALTDVFSGLAASERDGRNVSFTGSPERLTGLAIEPGYFTVLGVLPRLGRAFAESEDEPGGEGVVILSHRLFERRFEADPKVLGRSLLMDGRPYRIVGVMPRDFRTPEDLQAFGPIEYFIPDVIPPEIRTNRGEHILDVVGRLQPGVSLGQANAALAEVAARVARTEAGKVPMARAEVRAAQDVIAGPLKTPMFLLFAASGLIFLIACVNVASLLAARAVEEGRDVAVRVALGASQGRVVRESLARSLLLAVSGCIAGLLLANALKAVLVSVAPPRTPRLEEIAVEGSAVALASLFSIMGAGLFGVIPALRVSRARAGDALRAGSRALLGRGSRNRRAALVALEIGLAVLPLVGATLLLRSLALLRGVDLGFETERVLVASLPLPDGRYRDGDERFAFFEALAERARALPGVEAVGFANRFPLRGGWVSGILLDREASATPHDVAFQAIGGDYFQALGISVLRGRAFEASDVKDSPPVAVVNERFARSLLKGEPLGQRFRRGPDRPWVTIVGVVSDIRREGKNANIEPQAYLAAAQTGLYPVRLADLAIRTLGDPQAVVRPLQTAVWAIDPEQPLMNVRTLSETIDGALSPRRFQTLLLSLFAGLAMLLALIGVYGVVSATVAQRTQEIGVRMALGARASSIARLVLAQSLGPATAGLVAGLIVSILMARAMAGLVFGIPALDPVTFAAAPFALLAAVLLASLVPAKRAARVEPTVALRDE